MFLESFGVERFLTEYWQKKPLLIRQGIPDFHDPISPEELAGLACEEEAESRLILNNEAAWKLVQGPFQESDFTTLGDDNWTLLVQAVDHWFPELKELLKHVSFISGWRMDDIMVSYATPGASVGPHFDHYDVFMVQGRGSRTWKIGQRCDSDSPLLPDSDLRILESFQQQEEWRLRTGDVLYIPPGLAHYGVAMEPGLSYSIGFRAPSYADIVANYGAALCARFNEDQRYNDPDARPVSRPGAIEPAAIDRLEAIIREQLLNRNNLRDWFGRYMTESKYPENLYLPEQELDKQGFEQLLQNGQVLIKHPVSRFAFLREQELLTVFADGDVFSFEQPTDDLLALVNLLGACHIRDIPHELTGDPQSLLLLRQLYNQGSLIED